MSSQKWCTQFLGGYFLKRNTQLSWKFNRNLIDYRAIFMSIQICQHWSIKFLFLLKCLLSVCLLIANNYWKSKNGNIILRGIGKIFNMPTCCLNWKCLSSYHTDNFRTSVIRILIKKCYFLWKSIFLVRVQLRLDCLILKKIKDAVRRAWPRSSIISLFVF